tara:strand:- start:492 stop:782 length:291 start_codon:yes stop_codon:yes gene_type:complete
MNCPNCNESENIEKPVIIGEVDYYCYECPASWIILEDDTPFITNADWYCDWEHPDECDCGCEEGYGIPWSEESFYAKHMVNVSWGNWAKKEEESHA